MGWLLAFGLGGLALEGEVLLVVLLPCDVAQGIELSGGVSW